MTLAAAGQRTSKILMGTGVTCPTYRYQPAIVAEGFASLGLLNPGRIFLGVGSGEALNEVRGARLEEAVTLISVDPDVHIQAIQKLIDGGMTHIFIQAPQPDQKKVITFFGERVLPNLTFPRQPVGV